MMSGCVWDTCDYYIGDKKKTVYGTHGDWFISLITRGLYFAITLYIL
jgi:hypothetical protein